MDNKFIKLLKEKKEKIRYTYYEDGTYSVILKSPHGEYNSFAKAKKDLVKTTSQRKKDFQEGMKRIRSLKQKDIQLGEGEYFDVYFDGMYTDVEKSPVPTEFKSFKEAKSMAYKYLEQRFIDWRDAWKRAVALQEKDVEDEF